ncbi:MAG: hypothetical protein JST58_04780 [Bacteroidetes bacterium]|nr:hypothetical protein [Bacteroidota bacterium]
MTNKIKESMLNKKYGKYDLIEKELASEDILHNKPRVLLELICERYSLEKSDIKRATFYKWLARTKKEIINNEERFKWRPAPKKKNNIDDFQPTDPMEFLEGKKNLSTTILKRPNYSK